MDRSRIIEKLAASKLVARGNTYTIKRELGRGGNGVAFLCVSEGGDEVVSKVYIPPDTRDLDENSFKRFENEITLTHKLKHPYIVPSIGSAYAHIGAYKLPFYLMPLAAGTLRGEVRNDADPQQIERKLRLFLRAAFGVACLHSHGIVHRDLKPENILMSKHGIPWVADLGIAHVSGDFVTVSLKTAEDERLMNRDYYAPEQRFGKATLVDHRADIYALGCILYELLTSFPPVRANAPKLGSLFPVFKPIEPVWERMTAWEPADRYPQIEEALEDLSMAFGLTLATLRGVAGMKNPDVTEMSKLLRAQNLARRQQGLELAVRLGKSALPTLHSLIGHSKHDVRNWCAKALGAIADGGSVQYLVAGLYNSQTGRRSRFESFVSGAADALSLFPPDDRLRGLGSVTQPVEVSAVATVLGELRSTAAYDAVSNLRIKNFLTIDYGCATFKLLCRIDPERAWLEIEDYAKTHLNEIGSLIDGLTPARQATLLSMWINGGPDYGWRFEYMINAVGKAALENTTRTSLFDAVGRQLDSYKGDAHELRKMRTLLEAKRKSFADQTRQ